MRLLFLILSVMLLVPSGIVTGDNQESPPDKDIPSYAKWGRLAMKETQAEYPDAAIVDYLHRGRQENGDATVQKFKLWLQTDDAAFEVLVDIVFHTDTEEVIDISFSEGAR